MKKLYLAFVSILLISSAMAQNYKISGRVLSPADQSGLPGVSVRLAQITGQTNADGVFVLKGVQPGSYTLVFTLTDYEEKVIPVNVADKDVVVPDVTLKTVQEILRNESGIAEVSLNINEGDDETKGQNVSGLLQSVNDPFISTAAYTFGPLYFRLRGYDSENQTVYMSGAPVNDPENGRASWSEWGGLNDVTRSREFADGIQPADFSFGSLGGTYNIITRASLQRKQHKVTYSFSNRAYHHRLMLTSSSGMMKNGFAYTISLSRRWSQEGYVEGTFYDANAWFIGLEKRFNSRHTLAFTAYGAPTRRGQQGGSVQEAYDLTGSNYYNPYWGYQDGEKRNARVKQFNEPMFILNHYWSLREQTKLTTTVAFSTGRNGTTALNWYNAADPRPDYYRYLPSYQTDAVVAGLITENWKNNTEVSQVNWDKLYQINYLSNMEGKQARYILEENRYDHNEIYLTSRLNHKLNDHIKLSGGIEFTKYNGFRFKELNDLLGGNYWVDIDQFAERDFDGDTAILQNDLNNPNKVIREGDRFGYNYVLHRNNAQVWAVAEFSYNRFNFFAGAQFSSTTFWREGKMMNGRYPENSFGDSEKHQFNDPALKAGLTYKLSGRHYLTANLAYMSRAPFMRNVFISPRTSDRVVPDLGSEKIFSVDASYVARFPRFNARFTAYHTTFTDQSEISSFYHDDYLTFVNQSMYHINKVHQGIEFGTEIKATSAISVIAVAALGNFRYTNRPDATISFDNGSRPDTNEVIYCKNFYVPGTPQTATSLGLKYFRNYWFGNVNVNYFDQIYLDFNAERRTSYAISNLGPGDPLIGQITKQEKLNSGFTVDVSVGKSWKINKYYLNLNFSISNLLDNQEIITGGYEQSRFDFETKDISKFPPKYYYAFGRTFFLNIGLRI